MFEEEQSRATRPYYHPYLPFRSAHTRFETERRFITLQLARATYHTWFSTLLYLHMQEERAVSFFFSTDN